LHNGFNQRLSPFAYTLQRNGGSPRMPSLLTHTQLAATRMRFLGCANANATLVNRPVSPRQASDKTSLLITPYGLTSRRLPSRSEIDMLSFLSRSTACCFNQRSRGCSFSKPQHYTHKYLLTWPIEYCHAGAWEIFIAMFAVMTKRASRLTVMLWCYMKTIMLHGADCR
jgi:hypothetical protein